MQSLGVRHALVGNLGLLGPVREAGMKIHGDFGLNIYNSASMNVLRSLEVASATVSFEMTLPQIRDLSKAVNAEIIAYGRLPLMVTEHCLIQGRTGECTCHLGGITKLTDLRGLRGDTTSSTRSKSLTRCLRISKWPMCSGLNEPE